MRRGRPCSYQPRSSRLGTLTVALLLVLVTACSGNEAEEVEQDPQAALRDAVEAVGEWQGIALEVRLDADEAAQQALLTEGDMTQEDLDVLLAGRVAATIAALDDPETTSFEARVVLDDGDVLELRVTEDQRYFVRLDLQAVAEASDEEVVTQEDVDELIGAAETMGVGAAGEALANARWIELTGIEQLMNLAGASPQDDTEELDQATAERIAERTSAFIDEDVTVTSVGSDDIGERVRATTDGASLRRYLDDVGAELDDSGLVEDAVGEGLTTDLSDDAAVTLDAWVADGELRQVAIDLTSLDEEMELDGEAWLVVTMEEFTGSVAAPDEATTLDVFSLVGGFLGGGMEDGFGDDDGFEDDGFEDDGVDDVTEEEFDDDGSTDDGVDGVTEEEFTDDGVTDDGVGDEDADCITQEELDEIEQFLGEEGLAEIQNLIDAGILEVC
jgi:hypothetical protein